MCVKPLNLAEQIRRSAYVKGKLIILQIGMLIVTFMKHLGIISLPGLEPSDVFPFPIALGIYPQPPITPKMPRRPGSMTNSFWL